MKVMVTMVVPESWMKKSGIIMLTSMVVIFVLDRKAVRQPKSPISYIAIVLISWPANPIVIIPIASSIGATLTSIIMCTSSIVIMCKPLIIITIMTAAICAPTWGTLSQALTSKLDTCML
jgi:hypothetical protein